MLKKEEHINWYKKFHTWFNQTLDKFFGESLQKKIVKVKMLRTNWIFKNTETDSEPNDLFKLIKTLDSQNSDSLYSTEFVKVLIEEFWDLY